MHYYAPDIVNVTGHFIPLHNVHIVHYLFIAAEQGGTLHHTSLSKYMGILVTF